MTTTFSLTDLSPAEIQTLRDAVNARAVEVLARARNLREMADMPTVTISQEHTYLGEARAWDMEYRRLRSLSDHLSSA